MRQRRSLLFVLAMLALIAAGLCVAYLGSPRQETLDQRVQDVASQMKCPICQGESVQDSPSELAQQMRAVIRQQLQDGRSEQQVLQYFMDRYGPQIVWNPPWQGFSLLAWLAPLALFAGSIGLLIYVLRGWRTLSPAVSVEREGEAEDELATGAGLDAYRAQLERELATEDVLFEKYHPEVR